MAQYPPLTIFDENDKPVGEAMLEDILARGLLHRVVHVAVDDPEGRVLLQKRGPNVKTDPNTWDFAAAGYVDAGEDYQAAAQREVAEELGLKNVELVPLGVVREKLVLDKYDVNRFVGIFKAVIPADAKLQPVDPDEIGELRWFSKPELKDLINNSADMPDYFKSWLKRHYFQDEDHLDQAAS